MVLRVVEGAITQLGSVSGTDHTPIGINAEYNRAQRVYIENPCFTLITATGIASLVGAGEVFVTQAGAVVTISGTPHPADVSSLNSLNGAVTVAGTDGIGIITQSPTITVSGFRTEFLAASGSLQSQITSSMSDVDSVNAVTGAVLVTGTQNVTTQTLGQTITITGPDLTGFSTSAQLVSVSGHLQTQINNIIVDEIEPAIVGDDFIAVTSGADVTKLTTKAIVGGTNITVVSGSNSVTISSTATGTGLILGAGGNTVISGVGSVTVSGFRDEFVNASGSLQSQINTALAAGLEPAIVGDGGLISVTSGTNTTRVSAKAFIGVDGITVVSGSNVVTISGFKAEFVAASGSLQSQITSVSGSLQSQITHITISGAGPAIVGDDGFITVTTGTNTIRVSADAILGAGGNTVISGSNSVTISGFRDEFVNASGSLQTQITSVSGSLQSQINSILIDGVDEIEPAIVGAGLIFVSSGTNTTTVGAKAIIGTDGITVISGSTAVTISGFRGEFVSASGSLQTQINNLGNTYATTVQLTTVSGYLQTQIDNINVDEIEPAIIGDDGLISVTSGINTTRVGAKAFVGVNGITVISGSNVVTISGFRDEFVAASGALQSQISGINIDEIEPAIVGDDFIAVTSGSAVTKLTTKAIVAGSNITVVSGSNSITISSTATGTGVILGDNFISVASGSNSVQLSAKAILGAGGNTVISGANNVTVSGFRDEFVSASGSLQSQINSIGSAGVTNVNGVTGAVTVAGAGSVTVSTAGQTITVSGSTTSGSFSQSLTISGMPVSTGTGLQNVVEDLTPQLGGNLDVNGFDIISVSDGDINLSANGLGVINLSTVSGAVNILTPDDGGLFVDVGAGNIGMFTSGGDLTIDTDTGDIDFVGGAMTMSVASFNVGNTAINNLGAPLIGTDAARLQDVINASGSLQTQINAIVVDEIEPAIVGDLGLISVTSGTNTIRVSAKAFIGADGITVISGSNTVTISGFRTEFVAASGSLQSQIAGINTDEIEPAIVGDNGLIFVASGTNTILVGAKAILGAGGNTIISGTNHVTVSGFRDEFVNASGSLQTQISNFYANLPDGLISGGASWDSGLTFNVTALTYVIGGILYSSAGTQVTLTAADPTLDRIDVIVADTSGVVSVVTGTPSANPAKPQIGNNQVEVTFVTVEAGATTPATVVVTPIYQENLGTAGGEWNATDNTANITESSTTTPFQGTLVIEATNPVSGDQIFFDPSGTFNALNVTTLEFAIKAKAGWGNSYLYMSFESPDNVVNGQWKWLTHGYYGFDKNNTTSYQIISIPISQFVMTNPSSVTRLRFYVIKSGGALSGFFIDRVRLQTGLVMIVGTGSDANAIHRNIANEFSTITQKTTAVGSDLFLIEDSQAGFGKKKIAASGINAFISSSAKAIVGDSGLISVTSGTNTIVVSAKAILGVDGITVISGSNNVTISGFRTEFVAASGSLQSQITSINIDEIEPAIVGDDGFISVTSGTNTTRVSAKAIVGGTNVTVTSGSNTVSISSTGGGDGKAIVGIGGTDGLIFVTSGTNTISVGAKALVSDSSNLTITSGTNVVTFSPSLNPVYTSVRATTISGVTITGTTGHFSSSLTVSGIPVSLGGVASITASGTTLQGAVTLAGIGGDYLHVAGQTVIISGGLDVHAQDSQIHNKRSTVTVTRSGTYIERLDYENGDFEVVSRHPTSNLITTISGNEWRRVVTRNPAQLITKITYIPV